MKLLAQIICLTENRKFFTCRKKTVNTCIDHETNSALQLGFMACVSNVVQIACLVFHRTCSCIHGGLQYCDHYFVLQYFSVFERSVAIEITHIWINATLQQKLYCLYIILTNSLRNKEVKRVNQGRTKHTKKGNTKTSLFCFFFLTGSAVWQSFIWSISWISVSFLTNVPNISRYFYFQWFYKAFSPFRSSTQMAWHCLFERTSQIETNWEFCRFQVRVIEVFWDLLGEYFMQKLTTCKAVLRS